MLDIARIRAITLDLDDTLWPIWPTIERAEKALANWLNEHAPMTSALFANPHARHDLRQQVIKAHPELVHNLSAIRLEAIRLALYRAGEDPLLAQAAFEVFFEERQRVTFYDDALPALQRLAGRYPLWALSNGNADLQRVGLGPYFRGGLNAAQCGVGKPDVRIFQAAARQLNVPTDAVLHVGDDGSHDVLGGLAAGMQTVWVNRSENLWTLPGEPHETVSQLGELCDLLS